MRVPEKLGKLALTLTQSSGMNVSVKHRIGVVDKFSEMNDMVTYENLADFVETVHRSSQGAVKQYDVHSRCAVLNFNPKKNRAIPPLRYDYVYRLIRDFPKLRFSLNGEVCDLDDVQNHFTNGGVREFMIGRAVQNGGPQALDNIFHPNLSSLERFERYRNAAIQYLSSERDNTSHHVFTPLMNLFNGEKGSRQYRRVLNDYMTDNHNDNFDPLDMFDHALNHIFEVRERKMENCL
jgi:tRNA-dihydrouridine synthase A